jgi:hypothetical protein
LEKLVEKFPGHDGLRRSAQVAALREGDWARSLALWKTRLRDEPGEACGDAEFAARAAVPLRREAEVLALLGECEGRLEFQAVLAATRLAMSVQQDTEPWLARLESEPERQRVRLLAGLPVKDVAHTRLEPMARFLSAVHKSGDAVFAELPNLPVAELQVMDPEVAMLVWAEAVRRKHTAATTFARRTRLTASERQVLEGFVTGTVPELEPKRFHPLVRSIAWLTRSRAEGLAPAEKERLQQLVRKEAVLSGFVVSALDHWP